MEHATSYFPRFGEAGRLLIHLAHGCLLTAGLLALAVMAASVIDRGGPGVLAGRPAVHEVAVADPAGDVGDEVDSAPEADEQVLSRDMSRVLAYVSKRYRVSRVALEPLLAEAESTGRRLGLDPMLLVAVIAIESSFNPFAESSLGAQGLMQVIPRFHMDKIGTDAGEDALFDPQLNIRVGAEVLKEGVSRFGSLQSALQYYGGALDDPAAAYANKVLAMKARLYRAARPSGAA